VLTNDRPERTPPAVDISLLRSVSWHEIQREGYPASLGVARLQRLGLVRATGSGFRTTPAGDDMLDDDF
jgi:hypothetical protein